MLKSSRRYFPLIITPILVLAVGVAGYILIEGWPLSDALFMTIITLTTVGFGEVRPLSQAGRLFTVALILLGVGTVVYSLSVAAEYLASADLGRRLWRRRMQNSIDKMTDHVIVIGYGRVGHSAADALTDSSKPIVLIEREEAAIQSAIDGGLPVLNGDATDDTVLQSAGIERAQTLIVCTGDTAANLYIVLSARALNPNLRIIARGDPASQAKMRRAGADRVISPYQIGGKYMANIALRPHVTDFLDVVTLDNGLELWLEEITIEEGSSMVGQTVGEIHIRRRTGVTLVALLRHATGEMVAPMAETRFETGDKLIVLGSRQQLVGLEQMAAG